MLTQDSTMGDLQREHTGLWYTFCPAARDYLWTCLNIKQAWDNCQVPVWMRSIVYRVGLSKEAGVVYENICSYNVSDNTVDVDACIKIREYISLETVITSLNSGVKL